MADDPETPALDMLTENDRREIRVKLERQLEQARTQLEALRGSSAPVSLDLSIGRLSRVDAMQQQQMALAADRARQQRIARIKAALERMDQDEFGDRLECGEPIPDGRLTADPTALFCVECAKARGG
jgi:DnaK suppressor protein